MDRFSRAVINYKKIVLVAFLVVAALSGILLPLVSVNHNMVDYLPKDAQSTAAIKVM